jgi:hypothetical protein
MKGVVHITEAFGGGVLSMLTQLSNQAAAAGIEVTVLYQERLGQSMGVDQKSSPLQSCGRSSSFVKSGSAGACCRQDRYAECEGLVFPARTLIFTSRRISIEPTRLSDF